MNELPGPSSLFSANSRRYRYRSFSLLFESPKAFPFGNDQQTRLLHSSQSCGTFILLGKVDDDAPLICTVNDLQGIAGKLSDTAALRTFELELILEELARAGVGEADTRKVALTAALSCFLLTYFS